MVCKWTTVLYAKAKSMVINLNGIVESTQMYVGLKKTVLSGAESSRINLLLAYTYLFAKLQVALKGRPLVVAG